MAQIIQAKAVGMDMVAVGIALALRSYQTWLLNNALFPVTSEVFPLAREFQTAAGLVVGLLVLAAAWRRPGILRPRMLLTATLAGCAAGVALLLACASSPLGVTAGLIAFSVADTFTFFFLGIAFARLASTRKIYLAVACALLAKVAFTSFVPAPAYTLAVCINAALVLAPTALLWHAVEPEFDRLSQGQEPELLALANPRSFLSFGHQVYLLMLIFSAAFGFALSLRISEFTPLSSYLQLILLVVVVAWFVLTPAGRNHEDTLFAVAALLIVAGFLIAPADLPSLPATANGLLYAGNTCFSILSWSALAAICARNMAGALVVLSCGTIANSVGTFIGADLGHLCNALLFAHPEAAMLITAAAVLALFAYVLLGLRGFSFAQTIRGVEPAAPLPSAEGAAPSHDELFEEACNHLAAEGALTAREREVLAMLARGYNGYRIRDELTLSYNTVKTHVKRIYRKLDVHTQQELIELVEGRADDLG